MCLFLCGLIDCVDDVFWRLALFLAIMSRIFGAQSTTRMWLWLVAAAAAAVSFGDQSHSFIVLIRWLFFFTNPFSLFFSLPLCSPLCRPSLCCCFAQSKGVESVECFSSSLSVLRTLSLCPSLYLCNSFSSLSFTVSIRLFLFLFEIALTTITSSKPVHVQLNAEFRMC